MGLLAYNCEKLTLKPSCQALNPKTPPYMKLNVKQSFKTVNLHPSTALDIHPKLNLTLAIVRLASCYMHGFRQGSTNGSF